MNFFSWKITEPLGSKYSNARRTFLVAVNATVIYCSMSCEFVRCVTGLHLRHHVMKTADKTQHDAQIVVSHTKVLPTRPRKYVS